MSDNSTLPATGDVIRDIDRGSAKTQVFALDINPSGSEILMNGSLPIRAATLPLTSVTWNSSTGVNAILPVTCSGYSTVIINDTNSGSLTSGTLAFEVSDDGGTSWWPINAVGDGGSPVGTICLVTNNSGNILWRTNVIGFTNFRVRLQAQIAGGGGVVLHVDCASLPIDTFVAVTNTPGTPLNVALSGSVSTGLGLLVDDSLTTGSVNIIQSIQLTTTSSVVGNVAHGVADAGNPILNGGVAIAHGANPTAVATAQRTKFYANVAGVPFVIGGHPNIQSLVWNATTASVNAQMITGSTLRYVITQAQVIGSNNNTNFPAVQVGFGSTVGPTVLGFTGSQNVLYHPGIPAGGGTTRGSGDGIITIAPSASMPLLVTCGGPSGTLTVMVSYYAIDA